MDPEFGGDGAHGSLLRDEGLEETPSLRVGDDSRGLRVLEAQQPPTCNVLFHSK